MAITYTMKNLKHNSHQDLEYELAANRVKKLKGFYTHLLVYILVNCFIVVLNFKDLKPGESYFQYKNFMTALFWGIGLAAHGFSVFVPHFIFGNKWEERKIKEFMDKDQSTKYE